jgi:hypothetical protein
MTSTTPHSHPAQRTIRKARIGLWGKSGSGKTLTALKLARGLIGPEGKILVLDTEDSSSTIYADTETFDILPIEPPYDPMRLADIIQTVAPHYDVIILDSTSHEWMGQGGCLEQIDTEKLRLGDNAWAAWSKVTPKHNRFVEGLTRCPAHLICCLRAKTTYKLVRNERTKKLEPVMTGEAPIQREEVPYELDILARLEPDGEGVQMSLTKSRYRNWHGKTFLNPTEALGQELAAWLNKGVAPTPPAPDAAHAESDPADARVAPAPPAPAPARADTPSPSQMNRGELLTAIREALFTLVQDKGDAGVKARQALMGEIFGAPHMGAIANLDDHLLAQGWQRLHAMTLHHSTTPAPAAPAPPTRQPRRRREPGEEG